MQLDPTRWIVISINSRLMMAPEKGVILVQSYEVIHDKGVALIRSTGMIAVQRRLKISGTYLRQGAKIFRICLQNFTGSLS
jgi:hypothetical protein